MDPSDVINFVQREIVLTGNAHFIYNTERRRAIMGKTMPDNLDCISNKKCKSALSKAKGDLFGRKFLKHLAKESKDDTHLRKLLVPSFNKRNKLVTEAVTKILIGTMLSFFRTGLQTTPNLWARDRTRPQSREGELFFFLIKQTVYCTNS